MRTRLVSVLVCGVVTCGALAQQCPDPLAGFGSYNMFGRGALDVQAPTGSVLLLGVQRLGNFIYVTGRGKGATRTPPHTVYVFDLNGKLVRSFAQQSATSTSTWGWRDMATDGKSLFAGFEGGIHVVDTNGKLVAQVIAKNGVQKLAKNPIPTPAGLTTARGLAYDPAGNGGKGSLWVGDFGNDLVEIDLNGKVLRRFPPTTNSPAWSIYGIAWDPARKTLWVNSAPNRGPLQEIDPATGKYTGVVIQRNQPGTAQGGLCGVFDRRTGAFSLIGLDQGAPDSITGYRVHRSGKLRGETEARMLSAVGNLPLSSCAPKLFARTPQPIRLGYDLSRDKTLPGRPGLLFINFGPDALGFGTTPGFPELVARWPFSRPGGTGVILLPSVLSSAPVALTIPAVTFRAGDRLRMQMVYFEPKSPNSFVETNQVYWQFEDHPILVVAEGGNSFNADTTRGFWRVTNLGPLGIEELVFDWTGVANQATMRFDTNQTGMADRFDAGNSTVSGCRGTYRNNSDRTTGLIYDKKNTPPAACATGANTGWIGSNPGNTGDFKTLTFRFKTQTFNLGKTFEFDVDTDGGLGVRGGDMVGMKVTVKLLGGRKISGQLRRVSATKCELKLK